LTNVRKYANINRTRRKLPMPRTTIVFFQEASGAVPFLEWFDSLHAKAQDKCRVRLERLAELGHELRRPEADLLREGIYELRVGLQGLNYRMLYFFHGRELVVVSHGLAKEREVPPREIDRALRRKAAFVMNPKQHTYQENDTP
jgi:phage-related protein